MEQSRKGKNVDMIQFKMPVIFQLYEHFDMKRSMWRFVSVRLFIYYSIQQYYQNYPTQQRKRKNFGNHIYSLLTHHSLLLNDTLFPAMFNTLVIVRTVEPYKIAINRRLRRLRTSSLLINLLTTNHFFKFPKRKYSDGANATRLHNVLYYDCLKSQR